MALLEVGLRTSAAFSVRAILYRKFSGLDLPMTAFIFILSGSLLLCSVVLHLEGSKEAVEANNAAPVLEQTAHIETIGQTEAAALLRSFSQDSARFPGTRLLTPPGSKQPGGGECKGAGLPSRKGATAGGAALIRAKGAEMLANIEAERGAKFEALLERKNSQVERVKGRQYSAEDEANGRNKAKLQRMRRG